MINFFATSGDGKMVNLGGVTSDGMPAIPITLISDTELAFKIPAGAAPGPAYVQALNPPFIPFSSSGNAAGGAFILLGDTSASDPDRDPNPCGDVSARILPLPRQVSPRVRPRLQPRRPTSWQMSLITGGINNAVTPSGSHPALASAEIYDEASGTFSPTGSMAYERVGHTVTLLNNATILVAGGHNDFSPRPMPSAELYDIGTGTFSFTGSMNSARLGHTAVLLGNGASVRRRRLGRRFLGDRSD